MASRSATGVTINQIKTTNTLLQYIYTLPVYVGVQGCRARRQSLGWADHVPVAYINSLYPQKQASNKPSRLGNAGLSHALRVHRPASIDVIPELPRGATACGPHLAVQPSEWQESREAPWEFQSDRGVHLGSGNDETVRKRRGVAYWRSTLALVSTKFDTIIDAFGRYCNLTSDDANTPPKHEAWRQRGGVRMLRLRSPPRRLRPKNAKMDGISTRTGENTLMNTLS